MEVLGAPSAWLVVYQDLLVWILAEWPLWADILWRSLYSSHPSSGYLIGVVVGLGQVEHVVVLVGWLLRIWGWFLYSIKEWLLSPTLFLLRCGYRLLHGMSKKRIRWVLVTCRYCVKIFMDYIQLFWDIYFEFDWFDCGGIFSVRVESHLSGVGYLVLVQVVHSVFFPDLGVGSFKVLNNFILLGIWLSIFVVRVFSPHFVKSILIFSSKVLLPFFFERDSAC